MKGQSGNHMRRFDFSHLLLEPFCTLSIPGFSTATALTVSMGLAFDLASLSYVMVFVGAKLSEPLKSWRLYITLSLEATVLFSP